jgi:hypothetical protein
MPRSGIFLASAVVLAGTGSAAWAETAGRQPVVVELFTSQGCSSCPPANANLIALSRRSDVLALSFGVTYWDRLGWKDTFARPDFTARQESYEPKLGRSGPFTPQIVVNGRADAVGNDLTELQDLIARTDHDKGPDLKLSANAVTIASAPSPKVPADVWLVRYDPKVVEVPVKRGENGGRSLPHGRVVRDLVRLGAWSGPGTVLPLRAAQTGLRTAILVQLPNGGPILAAVTD